VLFIAFFTLLLVVFEFFGLLSSRTPRTPKLPAWTWIAALIGSYAVQIGTVYYAAHNQYPADPWRYSMPLMVVDDRGLATAHADLLTGIMLALAALQSYVLLAVYRSAPSQRIVFAGCAALLALSLAAPALMSFDLYGYVHDGLLNLAAYTPPSTPFPGEYHVFDLWFGHPSATLYGPLWLVIAPIVTSLGPTLLTKILALRLLNAALFVALVAGLGVLGLPPRVRAIAALNPGLALQFVANGHNDIIAIVLLVYAAAFIKRRAPWLGTGLIAVAGLVKLPYAILGLPVLAAVRPVPARLAWAIAMLAAVVACSWLGGGVGYFNSLFGNVTSRPEDIVHRVAGVVALALIALAFFGGRRLRTTGWVVPNLAVSVFAWYFAWGVPYALARRRIVSYVLVLFPFVTVLFESSFERAWELLVVLPIVAIVAVFAPDKRVTAT
jgi:hypothetical protein